MLRTVLQCLAVLGCGGVAFPAPLLQTSVAIPNGTTAPTVINAADSSIYSLQYTNGVDVLAEAIGQSDYGLLRNYVYSNIGLSVIGFESQASTHFFDHLTVTSPADGFLNVLVQVEGTIQYVDTPLTGFNSQTFRSDWVLQHMGTSEVAQCLDQGTYTNVPALPFDCTLHVALQTGTNRFTFSGALQTVTIGRASATEIDLFNTAQVTAMDVFDSNGVRLNATIQADSGTNYPANVPEPNTLGLIGLGLFCLVVRQRRLSRPR